MNFNSLIHDKPSMYGLYFNTISTLNSIVLAMA